MLSQIFLCFLVGFAAATSSDYAWKSNTQYEYEVQGRTLAGLHEVADQYAGVLLQAKLSLQRRDEGILIGSVSKAQYAQLHTVLADGWDSYIPDSKLNYQPLPLSQKPFEVRFKNGTVQELIVERDISNWEANMLKSIISQIQIDVQGENAVPSRYNRQGENDAMFKTMEDTVTGKCLTVYDINELPEYIMQSKPELVPMPQLKGEGDFIEVVKTMNYSDCKERIVYHYGLHEMQGMEPGSSHMGDFFLKSSVSRAILSGNFKRHTIQSSVTTNKIVLKPTPSSSHKGIVVSQLNITLVDVQARTQQPQQLFQPKSIGNLVYRYNSPFAQTNEVRTGSKNSEEQRDEFYQGSSEEYKLTKRHPRSLSRSNEQDESTSSTSEEEYQNWKQDKPTMTSEPETPLMAEFIGYYGKAIKTSKQINPVEAVQKLARKIAHELEQPSEITKEDTLATFTILTRLVRTMNYREIEEAGRELYTHSNKEVSQHVDSWKTYRDAIAQAGTGPALMTIQDWILTKKIYGQEAATVLATMAHSARHPTQEYLKTFYVLATKPEVQKQAYLNDTAILSYTELVRKVVVDEEYSHNQYPVHAFGKFSEEYKNTVRSEIIPYLKHQLERAIKEADSHKIHVYIRALGNVAHREILAVFEPYLEGKKEVSQFQRLFMVMSLDQLVTVQPKVVRTVLYKIYQNQGEETEIRVAAVYQLMKTNPPASMLQRMAEMTNEDSDEDVNAAVKSVIENAAQLQDPIYSELSEAAQAAAPLLNPTSYSVQYSHQHLKDYVTREMNIIYKQHAAYIGSEDSILPQGILYSLRSNMGGVRRQHINLVAMVSSVEQLFNVFEQQTEKYKPEQYRSANKQSKWASEQIAQLLNIEDDVSEELEGNVLLGMGQVKRFFTFDNQTIEQLPEYLKDLTADLHKGINFNYTKFLNPRDISLSFPTVMGIPFVYTLETPVLLSLNGQIRAKTHPELVSKNEIQMPEYFNLTSEVEVLVSTKTQAKIGFVTPFDHQQYIAGYDKHVQVYLPLEYAVDIDFENNNVRMEFQPIENDQNEEIFHYSSTPYTAKKDLLELKPVSQMPTSKIIHVRDVKHTETVYGEKKGLAFRVKYTGENKFMDCEWLHQSYKQHQGLSAVFVPVMEDYLTPFNLSVKYDADRTNAKSVVFQMSWNQTHYSGKQQQQQPSFTDIFEVRQEIEQDQDKRQEYFMKKAATGVNSVDASVFDFSVQFIGKKQPLTTYNATVAVATSPVDKQSRFIVYYNKEAEHERDFQVCLAAHNQFPNTNGLDYEYALKFDPTSTMNVQFAYGEDCKTGSKVNIKGKLYQSEERKRYLKEDPMTKVCKQEMEEGNKQLEGCRNMTLRANFMDRLTFDVSHEGISQYARNLTYKLYSTARYMGFYHIDEDVFEGHGHKDQIKFMARIEPDYHSVNMTLLTEKTKTEFKNIRLSHWLRPIVAVHPVFPVSDRLIGYGQQTNFRPTCVIDQTATNTFDNVTYPIHLGKTWHVAMYYRANSQQEQKHKSERFQSEDDYDYVVLARESGKNKKDIKIIVNDEKNYWEIDLLPEPTEQHQLGQVLINGKQVRFDNEYSYDLEDGEIAQVYALPNGEIKVEINNDLYVIYDGERVKLTTTSDKFRGDVLGLCGTFDGQQDTDFMTPKQCILENEREFAATYAVIDETSQGPAAELQKKAYKSPCYEKQTLYSNVITRKDIYGRKYRDEKNEHEDRRQESCSKHQTQYIEEEQSNEICFTVRPVPVCRSPCRAAKKIVKNIDVHCVQKSNVSTMWKKQIDLGSSPDFSLKQVHKQIKIKVAQTCAA